MKNNRALLSKRKSLFASKKDYIGTSPEKADEEFVDYKTASPELLEEIRLRLQKEKKSEFSIPYFSFSSCINTCLLVNLSSFWK